MTTEHSNPTSPKHGFVSQLKTLKTKFPLHLSGDVFKRLSLGCSQKEHKSISETSATDASASADFDCVADVGSTAEHQSPQPSRCQNPNFRLSSDIYVIPHPAKRAKGGEDAYFVCNSGLAMGVADGVGGWADKGIDPSLYSKTLMREAKHAYEDMHLTEPLESLKHAASKANKILGSSTACIVTLEETQNHEVKLKSANLGDSGFMLIRGGDIIYRTKEQQFHFNFPYQLGPTSRAQPTDAQCACVEIKEGDKIVLGTDGLFDNLFDYEIIQILNHANCETGVAEEAFELVKKGSLPPHALEERKVTVAELIARKASEKSRSSTIKTPFAQHAKANGMNVVGGKLDDITVLVATVTSTHSSDDDSSKAESPAEERRTTIKSSDSSMH